MLLAQLSDPHVAAPGALSQGRVDTAAALRTAVAQLLALEPLPDAVLLTGDLVDRETAAEYAHLRELLAPLPMPVHPIPGNHDDRALLRRCFAEHPHLPRTGEFLHYVLEQGPLRLIALDTHVPGEAGGALCAARLAWLAERLAEAPEQPTVLYMHHPPFAVGLPTDRSGCAGGAELGRLVQQHPQVERVLCGHVHRAVQTRWHGTLASTCPATAYQFAYNPRVEERSRIALEPPAFQLHRWLPGQGLLTHQVPIGTFEMFALPR